MSPEEDRSYPEMDRAEWVLAMVGMVLGAVFGCAAAALAHRWLSL